MAVNQTDLNSLCDALPSRLGIAVSGGADSMALLGLMLAQQPDAQRELLVLSVDHGLRPESADEVQMVHDYCTAHGLHHTILRWTGDKPRQGVQDKARQARRKLLIEACLARGLTDLAFGHQADDQLETFLQRLSRGAGLSGLRGMRARYEQDGVMLHRPLLSVARDDLRAYCVAQSIPFVDDPSNDDTHYERVRWRRVVKTLRAERGDFVTQFLRSQKRIAAADDALHTLAQRWIVSHMTQDKGKMQMPRAVLQQEPASLVVAILRQLMVTDKDYKVDLERLEDWVAQFCSATQSDKALTLDQWWLRVAGHKVTLQKAPPRRH